MRRPQLTNNIYFSLSNNYDHMSILRSFRFKHPDRQTDREKRPFFCLAQICKSYFISQKSHPSGRTFKEKVLRCHKIVNHIACGKDLTKNS